MPVLSFTIPGPAVPWERMRVDTRSRKPRFYKSPKVKAYSQKVWAYAAKAKMEAGADMAPKGVFVAASVVVFRPGPRKVPNCDADNVAKLILDVMTKAGVYADDRQCWPLFVDIQEGLERVEVSVKW